MIVMMVMAANPAATLLLLMFSLGLLYSLTPDRQTDMRKQLSHSCLILYLPSHTGGR